MKNPLVAYHDRENVSWAKMAKASGISLVQIMRLSKLTPKTAGKTWIETANKIKLALGVDLNEFINQ